MGNQLNQIYEPKSSLQKTKALITSKLGMKLSKKSRLKQNNAFIVELLSKNKTESNGIGDIESIDQRRTVFVSLIGLFQTYQQCPSYILYTSLIIIPLKREWIYNPYKYKDELESHYLSDLSCFHQDKNEMKQFIQFLQWKDSQGFAFWTLDDYKDCISDHNDNGLIEPFWYYFSAKLSSLHDSITGNKYEPLKFDDAWSYFENMQYMKYKTIKKIIYESNPKSLNAVSFYGQSNTQFLNDISLLNCNDSDDDVNNNNNDDLKEEEQEWYISTDYDPYEFQ